MRVIIAAAGTGGHINPGISIANKIMKESPDSKVIFIGTNRGLENDLVPRAGYELKHVEAYGLGKNLKNNLKTFKGIFQAEKIIKEFKPDIVIGAGGYICGPVIVAAHKLKIPTMLHESNAFPGKAVLMLSRITDTIMISFEDARNRIRHAKNIVLTGTPIKTDSSDLDLNKKKEIIDNLGLDTNKPVVLIFGGSQGAKKINEAVTDLIIKNKNNTLNYQIVLSAGSKQFDLVINKLKDNGINLDEMKNIKILPYIYNMTDVEKASNILICRSGATTIAEISIIGKPAIFIPLPNVSNNHQMYNAKTLESIGAALIIENDLLNADILNEKINYLISDNNKLKDMSEKAKKISILDTEDRIYNEILKLV